MYPYSYAHIHFFNSSKVGDISSVHSLKFLRLGIKCVVSFSVIDRVVP